MYVRFCKHIYTCLILLLLFVATAAGYIGLRYVCVDMYDSYVCSSHRCLMLMIMFTTMMMMLKNKNRKHRKMVLT